MDENGYSKGRRDALLESISTDLSDIKESLRKNTEWQLAVTESLSSGNEKFRHLDKCYEENRRDIGKLKDRDRNIGIISTLGSIIAAALGITINR